MINVLIIDDDAMVAELNRRYVAQIPGFQCRGTASTLEKAKEIIFNSDTPIDLILLDIYMQKENGLDLLPVLHNARCKSDVIVISSAADAVTIKDSLHYGVVDYLIKPFQASRFEEALTGWRQKKMALEKHQYYDQAELDQLIHGSSSNEQDPRRLPKGLTPQTLRTLCQWIDAHQDYEFSTESWLTRLTSRVFPAVNTLSGWSTATYCSPVSIMASRGVRFTVTVFRQNTTHY